MRASENTTIPLVDARAHGTIGYALEGRDRALALRDECLTWFAAPVRRLLPLLDRGARRWLRRSHSPYVGEIEAIARSLGFPGVWLLNGSYQWCCTAYAGDRDGVPFLARTLDWPFAGLGRHVEVAQMQGPAGAYFNVTWPGYVGALTTMAPGRFAAALNQAPLLRRTRHPWLRPCDIALNAVRTFATVRSMPPDHLLRLACERCADFDAARAMLEHTPVARPVIFILAGCRAGEHCVIERTEDAYVTRFNAAVAANDWQQPRGLWEARVGGDLLLTCSFDAANENSRARREALAAWSVRVGQDDFTWVEPPVLNPFTRVAVTACAATATLHVRGYEQPSPADLPRAVTQPFALAPIAAA